MKSPTGESRTPRQGVEEGIIRIYLIAGRILCGLFPHAVLRRTPSASASVSAGTGARRIPERPGARGWTERAEGASGEEAAPRGRASRGAGLSNFPGGCCCATFFLPYDRPLEKSGGAARGSPTPPEPRLRCGRSAQAPAASGAGGHPSSLRGLLSLGSFPRV